MKDALISYETYRQRDFKEPHFPEGHDFRPWSPTVGETIALASFSLREPIEGRQYDYIKGLLGLGKKWKEMEIFIADWNQALDNESRNIPIMDKLYAAYLISALIEERVGKYKLKKEDIDYLEESWARGNYEEAYFLAVKDVKRIARQL